MRFVEAIGWLAAAVAILLVQGFESNASLESIKALSLLPLIFGVRVFVKHGRGRITTLGLFNLSLSLFVGYSGIVTASAPIVAVSAGYLTLAVAGSFLAQVAITFLAWPAIGPSDHPASTVSDHDARWLTAIGALAFGSSLYLIRREGLADLAGAFLEGAAFSAVIVLAFGVFFRKGAKLFSVGSVVVVGTFFAYVELIHGGAGRLRLVALACALALLVSARFPRRAYKWAIITGTPLAIFWLAQQRLSLQESLKTGASAGHSGLESMTGTMESLAGLLEAQAAGHAPLAWGFNFLSAPMLIVPQQLLPFEKPNALGYELVKVLQPDRYGTGFSLASTVFGEWAFNFGILGFFFVVPAMAWALAFVDRRFGASVDHLADAGFSFMSFLVWVLLAGSIADLTWSGLHVLSARTLSRLPLVLVVGLVLQRQQINAARRKPPLRSQSRL